MKRASFKLYPNLRYIRGLSGYSSRVKKLMFFLLISSASLGLWNCSKTIQPGGGTTASDLTLKQSLTANAQNLNDAVNAIAQTRGYQILSLNAGSQAMTSSAATVQYQDSITLASIAGVYEYNPSTINTSCYNCLYKLFEKTDSSNEFIVKLPEEKVFHPLNLRLHFESDTSLKNNFVITASDYHYYFSRGYLYDYRLLADFAINDTSIGGLSLMSMQNSNSGYLYNSDYTFPDGYNFAVNAKTGDTISTTIMLSDAADTLLAETASSIKTSGTHYRERQYILTIGTVKIVRNSSNDSTQVYLNNVLQKNATVQIIDNSSSSSPSICSQRDVKITFDDGTSTILSTLLSPSMTIMKGLISNMENIYFATNIVDYIAYNVYENKIP